MAAAAIRPICTSPGSFAVKGRREQAMRPLIDYFIEGAHQNNIGADGNATYILCVPEAGRLIGVAISIITAAVDTATTIDVFKNAVDTGVDALLPITAENAGLVMDLDGEVDVAEGDVLHLSSNAEMTTTPGAVFNFIIRRGE